MARLALLVNVCLGVRERPAQSPSVSNGGWRDFQLHTLYTENHLSRWPNCPMVITFGYINLFSPLVT